MSITAVTEKYATARGSATVKGERNYTRVLQAVASSTSDGEADVFAATALGVPVKYAAHPEDSGALCRKVSPQRLDNLANGTVLWEVVCQYSSKIEDPDQDEENPLDRPVVYTWTGQKYEEARFSDLDGDPYTNTVGDPLDPPPLFEVVHPILVAEKNLATFDGWMATYYANKVNSDTFYGASKGYAKIESISGQGPNYENGVAFYKVTFEVHFNPRKWNPTTVLNTGPRYFETAGDSEPIYATDKDSTQSTAPVLLAANGTLIPADEIRTKENPGGTEPHYIEFTQYETAAFSGLGI